AAEEARGVDLLVSVGGGSVIDGTKAMARELGYPAQVAVPTTLSGAEWAHLVGVTDEEAGRKSGFADPKTVPSVVVLGLEGARRLTEYLPRSKDALEDVRIRHELQLAAWMAYFGPYNTPMGLSHGLGRRIGASYDVPHGYTSCVTLAPTLEVVGKRVSCERWEQLADALGGDPAERVASLVERLELPSTLRDVGVPGEDVDAIAEEFGDRAGDAREILRHAR